ncbi:Hypothetical protein SRAE_X000198200 [Strongyloides ratti]|uniref:Uncharacterized protein n=1 Tax=Strongyloides ratti TaxID=34506 RepID=A0A090MQ34_STRRB|nr:Hypothetical protein SRAE_X000198200 [Strongyloides ratti]CEF60243.1 Hypothetical protein SRAE_X000198200 [Strongyloides ratti]
MGAFLSCIKFLVSDSTNNESDVKINVIEPTTVINNEPAPSIPSNSFKTSSSKLCNTLNVPIQRNNLTL